MADGTHIEWVKGPDGRKGATWNPITGCSLASPGCTNCYAMKMAGTRLRDHPSRAGLTRSVNGHHVWTGEVRFNEQWLTQPLRWKRPRMIFVCAHGDLFHESVPDAWIDRVFAVMALAPQHTFQVLTKRAERMREYLTTGRSGNVWRATRSLGLPELQRAKRLDSHVRRRVFLPLPNVWLGVSVEDQARADERIPHLLATPAAVRWISAEPLLGPVDLNRIKMVDYVTEAGGSVQGWESALNGKRFDEWSDEDSEGWPKLDWVVCGGESGAGARGSCAEVEQWMRSLRDQCAAAGVAFFGKQNFAKQPLPDDLMVREYPV